MPHAVDSYKYQNVNQFLPTWNWEPDHIKTLSREGCGPPLPTGFLGDLTIFEQDLLHLPPSR